MSFSLKCSTHELIQKRILVGVCGASLNTWPKWPPQLAHSTATRCIPFEVSSTKRTAFLLATS